MNSLQIYTPSTLLFKSHITGKFNNTDLEECVEVTINTLSGTKKLPYDLIIRVSNNQPQLRTFEKEWVSLTKTIKKDLVFVQILDEDENVLREYQAQAVEYSFDILTVRSVERLSFYV